MYCPNCGNKLGIGVKFCNKCGKQLYVENKKNITGIVVFASAFCVVLLFILSFVFVFKLTNSSYYFSDDNYNDDTITETPSSSSPSSKYSTVIITDNFYEGVNTNGIENANKLIVDDSIQQKSKCPKEIKEIEDKIIKDYNIRAVNLCEMDYDFSNELVKVLEKIYNEFPESREYLTNLSITNPSPGNNYIAAFYWAFPFATSNDASGFPYVIKTQIVFNSKYYLNIPRLESGVSSSSKSGHFPPNANKYSPLAHELGHYLSFITILKDFDVESILLVDELNLYSYKEVTEKFSSGEHSKELLEEAYNNYIKDTNTSIEFDEWRNTISDYAVVKDNSGKYIYDETIAEGFHDYYLNGDNAAPASLYIIEVLTKHLKGNK